MTSHTDASSERPTGRPTGGHVVPGPRQDRRTDDERDGRARIDLGQANAARIHDYVLGGVDNFAVDRAAAAQLAARHPELAAAIHADRAFLERAVSWCLAHGVDQFLDLGSGIPTMGHVHEIARRHHPQSRVAYVDIDPLAVAHARALLDGLEGATITRADLREPDAVLTAPGVAGLLDLTRPVALLAVAVLHVVDGDLVGLLGRYRDALAQGSVLVLSHPGVDHDDPPVAAPARAVAATGDPAATLRDRAQLHTLLDGLDVVPPGLVDVRDWPHARPEVANPGGYGAVARIVRRGTADRDT